MNKTQLNKLVRQIEENKTYLDKIDWHRKTPEERYSAAVSMAVLREYLNLDQVSAFDALTDDGNDNKFDAFYFDDEDEIPELTIIQSKYKQEAGSTSTISEDEMKICIENCIRIVDGEDFDKSNKVLTLKLSAYRESLKNSNGTATIKLFFATNGLIDEKHKKIAEIGKAAEKNINVIFVDATSFESTFSLEDGELVVNTKDSKDKTDDIFLIGDDANYCGAVASCSIKELMTFYKTAGERYLLNNNVRYLIKKSRINDDIASSFINDPKRFCYLNNGISIACDSYKFEPTGQQLRYKLKMIRPSIINGGQTIATLYKLYNEEGYAENFEKAKILIRVYKIPEDYRIKIAKATNSQNPIDVVDLSSNDASQEKAKKFLAKEGIGLICKNGEDKTYYDDTITNENILQIYAALYFDDPATAKLSKGKIWKKYYDKVFNDSIDEAICKKLLRCYNLHKFIQDRRDINKPLIRNAIYSIIYTMKKIDNNILNENIPSGEVLKNFEATFPKSLGVIQSIVEVKNKELSIKFSLNNLFKGNEIKDLIDLKIDDN